MGRRRTKREILGMPIYFDRNVPKNTCYILPKKEFIEYLKFSGKKIDKYCCVISEQKSYAPQ